MSVRVYLATLVALAAIGQTYAQTAVDNSGTSVPGTWQPAGGSSPPASLATADASAGNPQTPAPHTAVAPRRPLAKVTSGISTLPNGHGQIWREYDISPYTLRVTNTARPEQALVDWILMDTGYETWHGEPLGILSATPRALRVYHTPEMQTIVGELVDRFVASEAETCTFTLRVITLDHPDWRAKAQRMLRPVQAQTPGTSAWVMDKEESAILLAELRRRTDFREHSSPHLMVNNGQSTVVTGTRPRNYIRNVELRPDLAVGFDAQTGTVSEGYSLDFSPLLSLDRRTIDASLKCQIDQIEKMVSVMVDVPTPSAPRQKTKVEVPQLTQFRFHERYRWPIDKVLLVELGMVPVPTPVDPKAKPLVPGLTLPLPLPKSPPRADLLVFIEAKGKTVQAPEAVDPPLFEAKTYRGRY